MPYKNLNRGNNAGIIYAWYIGSNRASEWKLLEAFKTTSGQCRAVFIRAVGSLSGCIKLIGLSKVRCNPGRIRLISGTVELAKLA